MYSDDRQEAQQRQQINIYVFIMSKNQVLPASVFSVQYLEFSTVVGMQESHHPQGFAHRHCHYEDGRCSHYEDARRCRNQKARQRILEVVPRPLCRLGDTQLLAPVRHHDARHILDRPASCYHCSRSQNATRELLIVHCMDWAVVHSMMKGSGPCWAVMALRLAS